MVDKNVFKMDMGLLQRFRTLQEPSASIERLVPKTFVSDANFNINPPVVPKQTIELGLLEPITAKRPPKPAILKKAGDTSSKNASPSLLSRTTNATKLAPSTKQPATKASLQALAAKAAFSSKSRPVSPVGHVPKAPQEPATVPSLVAPPKTTLNDAIEQKNVMRSKEDFNYVKFSQQKHDDCIDEWATFICPKLTRASLEGFMKAILPPTDLSLSEAFKSPVPVGQVSKSVSANSLPARQRTTKTRKRRNVKGKGAPAVTSSVSETPVSNPALKRPFLESGVSSALPSPDEQMQRDEGHPLTEDTTKNPSLKKARIKITKRRSVCREAAVPMAMQASNVVDVVNHQGHAKDVVTGQNTLEKPDATSMAWQNSGTGQSESVVDVKEEPIDFVDLLSLPDEPEDATKENDIQPVGLSPPPMTSPLSKDSLSKCLALTEQRTSTSVNCGLSNSANDQLVQTAQCNSTSQVSSTSVVPCSPLNHRFRRRFQQMLEMSCRKKRTPCHKFYQEEPIRRMEKSMPGSAVASLKRDSLEPSSASSAISATVGSSSSPIKAPVVCGQSRTPARPEVIIVDDDTSPLPPNFSRQSLVSAEAVSAKLPSHTVDCARAQNASDVSSERLSEPVTHTSAQPNSARHVARSATIPVQRVAPVCKDTPALLDTAMAGTNVVIESAGYEQQDIRSLLASPSIVAQEMASPPIVQAVMKGPAVKAIRTTSPPTSTVSPPRILRLSSRSDLPMKIVQTCPAVLPACLPSPPRLVQKIIRPSGKLPSFLNSSSNVNGGLVATQRKGQRLSMPSQEQQQRHDQLFQHAGQLQVHQPGQVQNQHTIKQGRHQHSAPYQDRQQQLDHQLQQVRVSHQQPAAPCEQPATHQQQEQGLASTIVEHQDKLYQCGYCGLTEADMNVVAMHIATCRS
ncbi:hypothetical protein BIW11_06189 [Tropilaelaps mercedesae]|uniref:Uncharacterized protein n=1 Tax=Tropilaelaps mercedesae TaxID=418985 RepID=A0A1V9XZ69_9ACAR|nr:hypothetical protein BIW11_06189 [Tropilaelaps mercedesae]OQR78775.1 hypothetical protein BIW11_06189 [Tropilaelaps mercedesae]